MKKGPCVCIKVMKVVGEVDNGARCSVMGTKVEWQCMRGLVCVGGGCQAYERVGVCVWYLYALLLYDIDARMFVTNEF